MKNKALPISIIIFLVFCFVIFLKGLNNTNNYIPDETLGKKISSFTAINFFNEKETKSDELFAGKNFYLLNIWASWCLPCRNEHKILMKLSQNNSIKIIGLNYKDNLDNAKEFINDLGNPYFEILRDENGTISIDLGAYGVPETFVIDNNKIILKKFVGPLNIQSLEEIKKLIK